MRAYSTARRISSLFCTQCPSSVIATTPACAKRTDRRQLFARQSFRDRAGRQHVDAGDFRRAILDPGDRARAVGDRRSIRHADDGGESARRGRARAGFDRLLPAESRLAQMDVEIDQARGDDEIRSRRSPRVRELRVRDCERDAIRPSTMSKIADFIALVRRIDDAAVADDRVHGVAIPPQR